MSDYNYESPFFYPNFIGFALSIAMVVVGSQYTNEQDCKNQAELYLLVGGGITLAITSLQIFAYCCCRVGVNYLNMVSSLTNLVVDIWGSVVVLGAYKTWNYKDPSNANFCEHTPYMFAFVLLILNWVMFPVSFCICSARFG